MPSTSLDLLDTDPESAVEFLESWHGSLPEGCGGGKRWLSIFTLPNSFAKFAPLRDVIAGIQEHGLDGLIYGERGGAQNVYHGVSVFKHRPTRGRGRISDVDVSPGAWLDVDVKDGAFTSGDDIMNFVWDVLDKRGLAPHIIVSTGSGGRHLYWRTPNPLDAREMQMWSERIWLWMEAETGLKIDNLSEPNRVLRLPGTLWLGKADAVMKRDARLVTMLRNSSGVLDMESAEKLTGGVWDAYVENRRRVRMDFEATSSEALNNWVPSDLNLDGRWALMHTLYEAKEVYNIRVPWDSILVPAGWTEYGEPDEEGHRQWTRPHHPDEKVNPRSLITDWEGSPHVAKLMSDSPSTGLKHLVDARIPLTKVNVAATLHFGGNVNELLFRFIRKEQGL